jgi:capsular exopolysaccharide synthesis family protein
MSHSENLPTSSTAKPMPPVPAARSGSRVPEVIHPRPVQAVKREAKSSPGMSGAAFLKAFRRRWLPSSMAGILCAAAAAAAVWFLMKPKATAQALLYVASNPPKIMFNTVDNSGEGRADVMMNYQKTQAALVKSQQVLNTALARPIPGREAAKITDLGIVREQSDPVEWLTADLQVDYTVGPELMRVALRGDNANEQALVVNAVVHAYLDEIVNKERVKRTFRLDQLKQYYSDYDDTLSKKRNLLKKLGEDAGSGETQTLNLTHQFALEQLAMAKKDLMACRSELRKLELEVGVHQAQGQASASLTLATGTLGMMASPLGQGPLLMASALVPAKAKEEEQPRKTPVPPWAVEEYLKQDPIAMVHLQRVAQLQTKIENLKDNLVRGKDDPLMQKPLRELEAEQRALEARRHEVAEQLAEKGLLRPQDNNPAQPQDNAAQQQERIVVLQRLKEMLTEDVNRLTGEARAINKSSLDQTSLREEISQLEGTAAKVATEMEGLKVEINAPPRVTLQEDAVISRAGGDKRRLAVLCLAAFASLALGVFGVCWLEMRVQRITCPEDVVRGMGVSVMGAIPTPGSVVRRRLLAGGTPAPEIGLALAAESVDATRTMLLHAARQESLRVVMITSALSGEGKTSLASHLAVSLARAGRQVLLMDCDLRKPALDQVFDVAEAPGVSELLLGTASVVETVQPTSVDGLYILAAGEVSAEALDLLGRDAIQPIFDQLKVRFDMIVVDSCPVLPVADALMLGQRVDAVLFSTLYGVSRLPTVHAAWQRLEPLGVRLLGVVLNGTRESYGEYYPSRAGSTY